MSYDCTIASYTLLISCNELSQISLDSVSHALQTEPGTFLHTSTGSSSFVLNSCCCRRRWQYTSYEYVLVLHNGDMTRSSHQNTSYVTEALVTDTIRLLLPLGHLFVVGYTLPLMAIKNSYVWRYGVTTSTTV